jgi:two-component system, cell cycle sensor histidine kinase and response regulator CckA
MPINECAAQQAKAISAVCAMLDVGTSKQELVDSEPIYRHLFEAVPSAIGIADQEGNVLAANPCMEQITGYRLEELRMVGLQALYPDPMLRQKLLSALLETGSVRDWEAQLRCKDGATFDAAINVEQTELGGQKRFIVNLRDITQYKHTKEKRGKAKAKYQALAEQSLYDIAEQENAGQNTNISEEYLGQIINCIGDLLFVKNREHNIVLVNQALCAFTGKPREELLGRLHLESLPKELAQSLWEREEEVFETGKECLTEDTLNDWQGNLRILMSKKSLLTDKSGRKQIVNILRDVTEKKLLEAQFLQAHKMEAVGALAGGVAHDFNNLLNVILGYTEMMIEELDPNSPMLKDLEQVKSAGLRATGLTTQLLAFSRKQILQPEIVDLNTIITDTSSMLRRLIGEDIELISNIQPNLGMAKVDPGKIQQVIMNLAINARDAMPQGGALIIETRNVDLDENYMLEHLVAKPGPHVMLAVSDNGIGIDAVIRQHIFEPFFTTKEKGKGTGLGLSTVYGIVKQSDGFIWVYSEPGKGTTFKIYFPRVEGQVIEKPVEKRIGSRFRGSETVLVVEDEKSVRAIACRILRERGYTTLDAPNGAIALDIAREYAGSINLVLTDVVMPGMSGADFVSRLKQDRPDIKALYISGYTDSAIVHNGALDSSVAFLQKPFSIEGLARKVREVIDS